jgi:hypothetical protein
VENQMDNTSVMIVAVVEQCRRLIQEFDKPAPDLPKALQPKHLLWMCTQIEEHAEDGPATKLHRWIGFVQGAMLANRMTNLDGLKAMFDDAKAAQEEAREDLEDLTDHLDPTSSFKFDLGGQG